MGLAFSFATATQIHFGKGITELIPDLIRKMGKRVLLVTGNDPNRSGFSKEKLSSELAIFPFRIAGEPTTTMIESGISLARQNGCDVVVGVGGGSVIDAAKAIAALAPNRGELMDYLEVIGKGEPLKEKPLPFIAVPTTSGTGAEVTKNSVIKSDKHRVKVSLRSDQMFPDYAVIDPALTTSMPPSLTASTGADAFSHLLETFVSCKSNPFVDMICREGLKRISQSLLSAYRDGQNYNAREDMSMASMLGGMALANVKLGAIHGFAGPMGGMYAIPHGAVCAALMPAVIKVNISALQEQKLSVEKYDDLTRILIQNDNAFATDLVPWVNKLCTELQIPGLSSFGVKSSHFPELIQKAKRASSMQGNPVVLSDKQLSQILEESM